MQSKRNVIVGTHNGIFHSDEVVACAIIKLMVEKLYPMQRSVEVIRTRDLNVLNNECDYVVDVGGGKFDHHQKGGNGQRADGTKYASAGLVWKAFGYVILQDDLPISQVNEAFNLIDENVIKKVDMEDNGELTSEHVFSYIKNFLPNWDERNPNYDRAFNEVLEVTSKVLSSVISKNISIVKGKNEINNWLNCPITKIGNVLFLPAQTIEWLEPVVNFNIENTDAAVDFVIFPYPDGGYAMQCVPKSLEEKFSQRITLPSSWAGETVNLPEISNVKSAIFCHPARFFARAIDFNDIITMCEIATLENEKFRKI